jgi:polycystin 2
LCVPRKCQHFCFAQFQFAENDLIEGLYWETWYNKGWKKAEINCPDGTLAKQPCKVPPSDRNVMYENRLLGLPRLRQLKASNNSCLCRAACSVQPLSELIINLFPQVTNNSCDIHIDFQKAIKVCFSPYAETKEDKAPYIPAYRNVTNDKAWVYNADTGAASHWGEISTYSGAGYIQDLHYLKDMSKEIISELKRGLWITQGTRFIGIDFTVYNANINLFLVGK